MSLTLFAKAIEDGDSNRVESMLKNGSVDVNARLPRQLNPPALVHAATSGQKDIVDMLLRFGARIDDTDDDGYTACHAIIGGNADVLALLLAHQPNLGLTCSNGRTPLDLSFMLRDREGRISTMLLEAGAPLEGVERRTLCQFAESTSAIQTLLRRGVVFSQLLDRQGRTPLHLVAAEDAPGCVAALDMLVHECGVDIEARSKSGNTCLFEAKIHENVDAMRFLIAAGANVQAENEAGSRTVLHIMGGIQCTTVLLAAGADVCARDELGRTPLHMLASICDGERDLHEARPFVNVMLAAGADLDAADQNGNTIRQLFADHRLTFDHDDVRIETARREIAKARLDFVRHRAWQVCIGLQSRELDALQMCEILVHACGPVAPLIPFHQWWKIATTVKHFKSRAQ
jgi:ankyrin repeat protein